MYFWRADKLAQRLKAGTITQKQKMCYLLILSIGLVGSSLIDIIDGVQQLNYFDELLQLISYAVDVIGILICYQANRKGDNREFLDRFICLSLPVGIRSFVFLLPFAIIILIVREFVSPTDSLLYETSLFDVIVLNAWYLYFYMYLRKHIAKISETRE